MPQQETGKQRAVRIPLDYFKQPNRLEKWKTRLSLLALVLAAAWCVLAFAPGMAQDAGFSRAKVAAVHATWEANCNACHVDFQQIRGASWIPEWVPHWLGGPPHAGSTQCKTCHEGPRHYDKGNATAGGVDEPECASCHRDHQGRNASLLRGFDSDCTQCHMVPTTPQVPATRSFAKVTRFDVDHPEFDSLKKERKRQLKFSHARHMAPGLGLDKRLSYVDEKYRKRYREAQGASDDSAAIKLDCASCHRTESADFAAAGLLADVPAAILPARAPGTYMLPITFENQCRACHPLTLDPKDVAAPAVPHRLQLADLRAFLKQAVIADMLNQKAPAWTDWEKMPRPIPGRPLTEARTTKFGDVVEGRVKKIETLLLKGNHTCAECHEFNMDPDRPTVPISVKPTSVPPLWFKHARFDHRAHRAVDCRECHPQAYESKAAGAAGWRDPDKVFILGRDACQKCHAPAGLLADGAKVGGARFDCAECHRYHNSGAWLEGLGSKARDAKTKFDIQKYLSGNP